MVETDQRDPTHLANVPLPLAVLSDDVPLVISRQLLTAFASEVPKLPAEVHQPVATQ